LKKSFTISRKEAVVGDPSILRAAILKETGSEDQAASILRSLDRMGSDPSILFYEMTLETRTPRLGGKVSGAWRVRADRGGIPVTAPPQ
jgi:hypothetical protein